MLKIQDDYMSGGISHVNWVVVPYQILDRKVHQSISPRLKNKTIFLYISFVKLLKGKSKKP